MEAEMIQMFEQLQTCVSNLQLLSILLVPIILIGVLVALVTCRKKY